MPDHVLAELEQDFELTGGRVRSPTVAIGNDVLVQPTIEEPEWALRRSRLARTA